ncbi:hypothetical protein IS481_15035 [Caldimonas thermodepolymerans]|jgi:hypothetical protein|uniref:Uncharacterized protein n=1 Tax=Caldimonas thermodepolymerans TaxID=215580 RepID=A0A2S5T333_9BURK|nr:hypothetical protein [Caldimonas thermodepolymerans]PPE69308.1 hypothetical protein C1702_12485 [Caldimonas thermodepolymerans]QPC31036.1 hypothetical protein IS481_15035 [Caldimonas thermodepolymerans]RDH96240.1 hypothetical protein DES46_11161 [Caldimonas thermodepolymerans]TCP04160.1 hypothetical protein EV676_11161 [Caldimonas thermodepolymerans]UZG43760.1 hypothetical protein ONZ46_15430 [Caldimonas thermodepolymerans]
MDKPLPAATIQDAHGTPARRSEDRTLAGVVPASLPTGEGALPAAAHPWRRRLHQPHRRCSRR